MKSRKWRRVKKQKWKKKREWKNNRRQKTRMRKRHNKLKRNPLIRKLERRTNQRWNHKINPLSRNTHEMKMETLYQKIAVLKTINRKKKRRTHLGSRRSKSEYNHPETALRRGKELRWKRRMKGSSLLSSRNQLKQVRNRAVNWVN
jgi:hypothetical protein